MSEWFIGLKQFGFLIDVDACWLLGMFEPGFVNPNVLSQPVYEPGRPIEDVVRELGLNAEEVIKLASNENALGSSPAAIAAMQTAMGSAELYPDGGAIRLRERIAQRHGVEIGQVVVGNGSNEIIELLGHVFLKPGDEVVMGAPAFIVYKLVTLLFGAQPVEVPLINHVHDLAGMKAAVSERTKLVFLPCPNNPTGTLNPAAEVVSWVQELPPHVVVVIDEAYAEYLENETEWSGVFETGRPLVLLRTFSKIFGLAALRVGYAVTNAEVAALLQRVRQPFNSNAIGQAGALAALDDRDWLESCRRANKEGLLRLQNGFDQLGLEFVPSCANFVLVKVGQGRAVFAELQKRGIIVRPVDNYGMPEWVRVSVGSEEQNKRLLDEMGDLLAAQQGLES